MGKIFVVYLIVNCTKYASGWGCYSNQVRFLRIFLLLIMSPFQFVNIRIYLKVLIRQIVLMKLEAVGLRGAATLMPSELSGGMARRAALARAIALDPDLIMFDEPFTGQDPISMGVILSLIKRLNEALNLTSIVVSHDVEEVLSIADYAYIIADQKVIAEGTSEQLLQSQDPRVVQFLKGESDGPVRFKYPAQDYVKELFE